MTEYAITFAASAKRELKDLPSDVVGRLLPKIRDLVRNPRPMGCKKLQGQAGLWRIRIGNYRVVYVIDDAGRIVDVTRIAHRKDVYE